MQLPPDELRELSGMTLDMQANELKGLVLTRGWKIFQKLGQNYINGMKSQCLSVEDSKFPEYKARLNGAQEMLDYVYGVLDNWEKEAETHEY